MLFVPSFCFSVFVGGLRQGGAGKVRCSFEDIAMLTFCLLLCSKAQYLSLSLTSSILVSLVSDVSILIIRS